MCIRLAASPMEKSPFAAEMMEQSVPDGRKKFKQLSLGMKTMASTIICLASRRRVSQKILKSHCYSINAMI